MKKTISFLLCAIMLCACNSNEPVEQKDTHSERGTSSLRKADSPDEKKKIDWASVAIADGGGAALGAELAKYSGNIYVMMASAAGVGAYASYCEYERQKEDLEKDNCIYRPDIINPFNPFLPNPLIKDNLYNINNKAFKDVGETHNRMVLMIYEKYNDVHHIDLEALFHKTLNETFKYKGIALDADRIYGMSETDLFNIAVEQAKYNWEKEQKMLLDQFPKSLTLLKNHPIEETLDYINSNLSEETEKAFSESAFLSVAYYSKCIWNTMAPDPIIAQECIAWDPKCCELKYICGRSEVKAIIEGRESECLLYPAYGKDGLIALYLYTGSSQYGRSEFIKDLVIKSDLCVDSKYFKSKIFIPKRCYKVEPTKCNDIYVVRLDDCL